MVSTTNLSEGYLECVAGVSGKKKTEKKNQGEFLRIFFFEYFEMTQEGLTTPLHAYDNQMFRISKYFLRKH
jgi:hypothetical protein